MTKAIQDDIRTATTAYDATHELLAQLEMLADQARQLLKQAEANNAAAQQLRAAAHAAHAGLPCRAEVYAEGCASEDDLSGLTDEQLLARRLEDNLMVAEEVLDLAQRLAR